MATSSLHYAQDEVKILCDLCDTLHQVNSYCKQCCCNICDNCKKIHFRLNKNHNVVPVFEGRLENIRFKVKCKIHEQRFLFYCENCKFNICEKCITTEHIGHRLIEVSEHAHTLKQNFVTKLDTKKYYHKEIKKDLKTVEQHGTHFKTLIQSQIETVRKEIENKQKKLKADGEKLIEKLEIEEKNSCKIIRDHYQKISKIDNELDELNDSVSHTLTIIPDAAVFNFVRESETKLDITTTDLNVDLPNPPTFAPSSPWDQGSNLIGVLNSSEPTRLHIDLVKSNTKESTPVDPPTDTSSALLVNIKTPLDPLPSLRRDLQVLTKFKPARGNSILDICSTDDDLLWVSTSGSLLFLVDKKGKVKSKVKMPGDPCHIAVTCRGDVIVSTFGHVIYHVTRQGHISTLVDLSPDEVRGITTTRHGDVFACVVDSGSGCKVKKFTAEGDFVLEVETNLFTARHQYLVHSVSGDTVCIQDGYPEYDDVCNLTFVDAEGQLISRVTRTGQLREDTERILWDGHGHVVTGTWKGEYIHVFDGDGTCRQSYHVKGSKGIHGLCLGRGDVMLIGTYTGEVIVAKYLE